MKGKFKYWWSAVCNCSVFSVVLVKNENYKNQKKKKKKKKKTNKKNKQKIHKQKEIVIDCRFS